MLVIDNAAIATDFYELNKDVNNNLNRNLDLLFTNQEVRKEG